MDLEGKWKAIFIGAFITGLAPLVPFLKLACCLIPLVGAFVSVAVYSGSEPSPGLDTRDGMILGMMTGLVGSALYAVLVIPLAFILGSAIGGFVGRIIPDLADLPARLQPLMEGLLANFGSVMAFLVVVNILGQLAQSVIFGVLGGLLGVALFRRKTLA